VSFTGVNDEDAARSHRFEESPTRRYRLPEQRDVVTERLAESARLQEIALHINHHDRGACQIERQRFGFCVDYRAHASNLTRAGFRQGFGTVQSA
jgi:hypothetical protein